MTGHRTAWVPIGIAVAAAIYLWNLVAIRLRFGTTYNDFFAIPITALLLVGSSVEVARSLRRIKRLDNAPDRRPVRDAPRYWMVNPRVRLALLLVLLVVGLGRVPFILLCTAVLTLGVAVIEPGRKKTPNMGQAAFYTIVAGAALVLSTLLFVGFTGLGARL